MTEVNTTIAGRVSWAAFEGLPAMTANQFLVQIVPSASGDESAEILLNIGFLAPPTITADADAMRKFSEEGVPPFMEIPVQAIARISISPARTEELHALIGRILTTQAQAGQES